MNHEQFSDLVARLEPIARRDPRGYESRVILLALLGYGYLGLIILLLLAALAGSALLIVKAAAIALKLIVIVGALVWMVLRSLWLRIPAPEGVRVTANEVPALFDMIERLRGKLDSARFHEVVITDDFNAAVLQIPRLGPFGWHRNYLMIGLPLMKALTPLQLEAVLAHEFGHLAGGHGAMANHLYRLRISWSRLLEELGREHRAGRFLFEPFFKWFAPYFSAYSFPLARNNEYHADQISSALCGAQAAAQALTATVVVSDYLGTVYWPGIHKQADSSPRPAFSPFSALGVQLSTDVLRPYATGSIERALGDKTGVDNTHPAFSDRLRALGQEPDYAPPAPDGAADQLLGAAREHITKLFDDRWQESIAPSWKARYESAQEGQREMAALAAREQAGESLSDDDALRYALMIEDLGNDTEEAISRLHALVARAPGHASAALNLGFHLLARNDHAGIALVERAMALDDSFVMVGCQRLYDFCVRHDMPEDAKRFMRSLEARTGTLKQMADEVNNITLRDRFVPHGLTTEALDNLVAQLRAIGGLRRVYLVRRLLKHQPDVVTYVLAFIYTPWWKWQSPKETDRIRDQIVRQVDFPGHVTVFCGEGENHWFEKKFRKITASRIL
jgi:Zn-dependent protease with chaperone function